MLEPLLPQGIKAGRSPVHTKRQLINGMRFRTRTGVPWRDLPERYGPWETVCGLFRRWQRDGTWHRIFEQLQARADAKGLITWDISVDSTIARAQKGDLQVEPPGGVFAEPNGHGLGRSRGGLTTKIHLAAEQAQKLMSLVITAGQRGDSPQFQVVLGRIRVPRLGPGRPRTRPDKVRTDRAYGSRANRAYLRRRGIGCTIPEKARPDRQPQEAWFPRRSAAEVCQGRLPRAPRGGVRDQPPQAPPRGSYEIRQARRPLRSNRADRSHQRVAVSSTITAWLLSLRPLPSELEEEAEAVTHGTDLDDPALGQGEDPDRLVVKAPASRLGHAWVGSTVDSTLSDAGDHLVALADQFVHTDCERLERDQLLTKTLERGSRLVDLPMDDLVVVHDIVCHEPGKVPEPTVADRFEEAQNDLLVVIHH